MHPRIRRIAREIVGVPGPSASFRITVRGDTGIVATEGAMPLAEAPRALAEIVLEAGLYDHIRGESTRIELLARAAEIAPRVVVVVEPQDTAPHAVRAALDGPRRILRAIGAPLPEPGDRFPDAGYVHLFVDDEALLAEAARAGLAPVGRDGARLTFVRGAHDERPEPFAVELARAAVVFPRVRALVEEEAPDAMVRAARTMGRARPRARGPIGRARLHRAIAWIDATTPPAPGCFRRVLAEVALDAGAAEETLVFGLDVGRTGHVAFARREVLRFDVAFEIPP